MAHNLVFWFFWFSGLCAKLSNKLAIIWFFKKPYKLNIRRMLYEKDYESNDQ